VLAQGAACHPLALEILQHGSAQVGAVGDFEQVEQGCQGNLMVLDIGTVRKVEQPPKQVLDPEQGPDSFVAGVLVKNHAIGNLYSMMKRSGKSDSISGPGLFLPGQPAPLIVQDAHALGQRFQRRAGIIQDDIIRNSQTVFATCLG